MSAGLSIALSALYAQRQAIEITGHNIANANTAGYTRQRVQMASVGGANELAFFSVGAYGGRGVEVGELQRLSDAFLTARSYQESGTLGMLKESQGMYDRIELAFAEPGTTGLQSQLAKFWGAWDDLSNRPGDAAARSQLLETTRTLTSSFNQAANALGLLQDNAVDNIRTKVAQVNELASNIAELNQRIRAGVAAGTSPNDLMDQRDLLISEMSDLAGVTTKPGEHGTLNVYIGGTAVVRENTTLRLQVDASSSPVRMRWDGDNDASTSTEGSFADVTSGRIGSLLSSANSVLPGYLSDLDALADQLRTTLNTQHAAGFDRNGNAGGAFFDAVGTGAAGLQLDPTLSNDASLIAAASTAAGTLGGENARLIGNLATSATGPDATYRALINKLGVEASRTADRADIQESIFNQMEGARQSESGVNLDEEMANLVQFQQAYSAAAKFFTAIDEMMQTLIATI